MYKQKNTFEKRIKESENILKKYPNRIPVIVEKNLICNNINDIDKNKYLVPEELTIGQFIFIIRKRLKLSADKALFIFINSKLIPTHTLMKDVYLNEKDEDNFLYIIYASENTFG